MTTYTNPHSLPLVEPTTDYIKDTTEPSALAGDINALALAANSAIGTEGARAEQGAIDDATAKYGSLPQRMTDAEAKNVQQDSRLSGAESKNTEQDGRLGSVEATNTAQGTSIQNLRNDVTVVQSKNTEQDGRLGSIEVKNTAQDSSIQNLRDDVTFINAKNVEQDGRIESLEELQPVKSVRMEGGQWVWDPTGTPTHYLLFDHDGNPTVRATPWPVPNPTTPEFTW